jgi:MurNAc alpha-1-phosphate uridylyltransferase
VTATDRQGVPKTAMVLAAGLGARMKPLTDTKPKPLIEVAGKTLIDHTLDRLAIAGVEIAIVNVHHFADALERHLQARKRPRITISDERNALLDTGGGIIKALQQLGPEPFLLMNSDSLWLEGAVSNLKRLGRAFDAARMDALLLLAPSTGAIGYRGRGDYGMDAQGNLQRRGEQERAPLVYAGAAVLSPRLFAGAPAGAFSLTRLFDRAEAEGRLHGLALEGTWMHVGSPEAIGAAEEAMRRGSV